MRVKKIPPDYIPIRIYPPASMHYTLERVTERYIRAFLGKLNTFCCFEIA